MMTDWTAKKYMLDDWAEFPWPDWIIDKYRDQISEFWCVAWGRGPKAWIKDMQDQSAPKTGGRAVVRNLYGNLLEGRYLHCWNNIGRVLLDDGSWHVCSIVPDGEGKTLEEYRQGRLSNDHGRPS